MLLYGSLITKEFKKKHSPRTVGGVKMGSQGGEDLQQGGSWRTGAGKAAAGRVVVPCLCAKKLGGTTGEQDRPRNTGLQRREIEPQNL